MTLEPGTSIGPYRILERIGVGGMGEVYRAHDTVLDRDVAVKVLAQASSAGAESLTRFDREARLLASLNHPNVGAIFGVEQVAGTRALILELVEGPTLADRIARGPMAAAEAMPVARQIATALEAAHERGIVHRDLKPSNVKIRPDGAVKVLDFGVAKVLSDGPLNAGDRTTTSAGGTREGVVVGTAAYMSPEQVSGRPVDRRTDIWAFGCVLYEMLTGRRAFGGERFTEILARVLEHDPEIDALPHDTPAPLRRLVMRCLRKDPRERLRDIGDARLELEEASSGAFETRADVEALRPVRRSPTNRRWLVATGSLAVAAAGVLAGSWLAGWAAVPGDEPIRVDMVFPQGSRW